MEEFRSSNRMEGLSEAVRRLERWIDTNGWAGFDPYDIKGHPLFLRLRSASNAGSLSARAAQRLLAAATERNPSWSRRLLRVRREVNAKALGLLAKAYLSLFEATREQRFKDKAVACLDWLLAHPSSGYHGLCWGYPFDWQSKVLIPRGTPSAVVSTIVGDAFWTAHRVLEGGPYLETCRSICEFVRSDLNIDRIARDCLCFSYTPIDDFHVHNANLLVADFLVRVGRATEDAEYVELGRHAAHYALREQNGDGSLYYWGRVQDHYAPSHLDHYHSGFEIRALLGIWASTEDPRFLEAARRYYEFYRANFFAKDVDGLIPKMSPESIYPIDIHSCAEALICNATALRSIPSAGEILPDVFRWVVSRMQMEDGHFAYRVVARGRSERILSMPYIRWGQAWMLLALSACVQVPESPTAEIAAAGQPVRANSPRPSSVARNRP